jgi:hypothetical protein
VLSGDALVIFADRDSLSGLEKAPRALGEFFDIHFGPSIEATG